MTITVEGRTDRYNRNAYAVCARDLRISSAPPYVFYTTTEKAKARQVARILRYCAAKVQAKQRSQK